ncbi:hypothetical protein IF2G_01080 [Cordyceps javanica]|nr:hypothetical protein IF2G_01080 [Cordyceps javanica]
MRPSKIVAKNGICCLWCQKGRHYWIREAKGRGHGQTCVVATEITTRGSQINGCPPAHTLLCRKNIITKTLVATLSFFETKTPA